MLIVVVCGVSLWLFLLVGLARIQIVEHHHYDQLADRQHTLRVDIPCSRGRIVDRYGKLLAGSVSSPSVIANPAQVADPGRVSRVLSPLLNQPVRQLKKHLSDDRKKFVWLRRKVEPALWEKIESKELPGIYCIPEMDRVNPYGDLASHVVGATDVDDIGLGGIEKQFDSLLCGTPGWQVLQRVPSSECRPVSATPSMLPIDGCDVVLTLDADLQSVTELELQRAIEKSDSWWGMALLMDPRTGEILAMANERAEDGGKGELPVGNQCVIHQFEPGSTFKLITFAAALEEKSVTPDDLYYAWNGVKDFGGYRIHDSKKHDTLTVRQAFELSSNIVTAQIAQKLGRHRLYSYARDFGIGSVSGIALPGEMPGILEKPAGWSGRSLETISIGHEVAVNLVQLVSAFSAIANDGVLMEPRIVREVRRADGSLVEEFLPLPVRRVVSAETARTMRDFLAGVVERGTAREASVCQWPTGGKSGTAQMLQVDGRFSQTDYISSFVGFVPVGNPRVVAAVVLVDPSGISAGGIVAGPVFRDILTKAVCSDLSACFEPELQKEAVKEWLRTSEPAGDLPSATAAKDNPASDGRMPDLVGLPLRAAKRILLARGVTVRCEGSGDVKDQTPHAGDEFRASGVCLLSGSRP